MSYTADTRDFREIFAHYSKVPVGSIGSHLNVSIFRGTPDTVIKRNPVTVVSGYDYNTDAEDDSLRMSTEDLASMTSSADSDYFIGEIVKPQNLMTAVVHGLPEKLGELMSNMWWMATAKLVKCLLTTSDIIMEGFLLDKAHGGLQVQMTFRLDGSPHTLKVLSCANGILSSDILCKLFKKA